VDIVKQDIKFSADQAFSSFRCQVYTTPPTGKAIDLTEKKNMSIRKPITKFAISAYVSTDTFQHTVDFDMPARKFFLLKFTFS